MITIRVPAYDQIYFNQPPGPVQRRTRSHSRKKIHWAVAGAVYIYNPNLGLYGTHATLDLVERLEALRRLDGPYGTYRDIYKPPPAVPMDRPKPFHDLYM